MMNDLTLLETAAAAANHSLVAISRRPGGAALETASGRVFVGARIEISNLGSSICAARVAMFSALAAGEQEFGRLAVVGPEESGRLCGECRQVLRDIAPQTIVVGASGAVAPPFHGLPRCRPGEI